MKHEPKKYTLFCCACGDKFIATRSDARTCSNGCRLAMSMLGKIIKSAEAIPPEDKAKFDEANLKVKEQETGIVKRVYLPRDEHEQIILPKAVIDQLPAKEKKPKKEKPEPMAKNDKNLIPGKSGYAQAKLDKKKTKK